MPRIKRGTIVKKKHKKLKKQVKGYLKTRRASVKKAKEALIKAGQHAYRDRRRKKREMRRLWIIRLNAALREQGLTYSEFINLLKKNKIGLDRKILSQIAEKEPKIFKKIIQEVKPPQPKG